MGAFTFTTVPVIHSDLRADLQTVNLFTDSETGVLAGFRGDRAMGSRASCLEAAARIDAILRAQFPVPFKGKDSRYKHQTQSGDVVAGVRCSTKDTIGTLTLEVTNPDLEERLMRRARNER
jgi:hypothetical protein